MAARKLTHRIHIHGSLRNMRNRKLEASNQGVRVPLWVTKKGALFV